MLVDQQRHIGPWTRAHDLTSLQAAADLAPSACSLAFSIRELVRQAYLLGARILLRPLVERVATLAYRADHEDAVDLWHAGWPHKTHPSLATRLASLGGAGVAMPDDVAAAFDRIRDYNSMVPRRPAQRAQLRRAAGGRRSGLRGSKDVASPARADGICRQASAFVMVLTVRCAEILPAASR